ncbi:unnamed protein product [Orchesella dallaii]|uniref:Leucine-rich repeat-containing protein 20 n=1 Tax=Orchesella dallaii TaxID=48710 RepID=A0ABP1PVM4_9HEXA
MRPKLSDLTNNQVDEQTSAQYHQAMMCTRLAGHAIIRVVGRCKDAQENENLDLSECQLMQVPDAVFHLMRHTTLKTCDLSFNVITKIPPILAAKFSCITELNVSNNRMSKLPEEIGELQQLVSLNISHNAFVSVPRVTYTLPKLEQINAEKNYISDVDAKRLAERSCLKVANFRQNPLNKETHDELSKVARITILLSPIEDEDWDKQNDY